MNVEHRKSIAVLVILVVLAIITVVIFTTRDSMWGNPPRPSPEEVLTALSRLAPATTSVDKIPQGTESPYLNSLKPSSGSSGSRDKIESSLEKLRVY